MSPSQACRLKRRYRTEYDALDALAAVRRKGSDIRRDVARWKIPVRVYECPVCDGFHLTSRESR